MYVAHSYSLTHVRLQTRILTHDALLYMHIILYPQTSEFRDILDRITKRDPDVSSTRWQKALDELQELRKRNSKLVSVIATLNEQQSRSLESQRQLDSKLEEEKARYSRLHLELNHWKARYIQMLGCQMEIPTGSEFVCE